MGSSLKRMIEISQHEVSRSEARETYGFKARSSFSATRTSGSEVGQAWKSNRGEFPRPRISAGNVAKLVAVDHVLRYALQADDRIANQRQGPELAVMLPQHIGRS